MNTDKVFEFNVHIVTTSDLNEEQLVADMMAALQKGNEWIGITPVPNIKQNLERSVATAAT